MVNTRKIPHNILENGAKFINENPSVVKNVSKVPLYNDEPQIYGYSAILNGRSPRSFSEDFVASGFSFDKNKALVRLFGETIERYSLSVNNKNRFIKGSFTSLSKAGKNLIAPSNLFAFTKEQSKKLLVKNDLSRIVFRWIEATSLISNQKVFVPAQLVFVPYIYQNEEPVLRQPISTGAAAGYTLKNALYRGICEVVERDAFMISYLNEIESPKIDINDFQSKNLSMIASIFKRYKLELHLIDLTLDIKIPSVAAIIVDRTGLGPAITVGLKSGFDIEETIIGAVEEALMIVSWVRDKFVYLEPKFKAKKNLASIDERAYYWFSEDKIQHLDFWIKSKYRSHKVDFGKITDSDRLSVACNIFRVKKMDLLFVDLADENIERYGFKVVKVIIPELMPLYLDETLSCFGNRRLYEVPVSTGFLKEPKVLSQLNRIPHPFL